MAAIHHDRDGRPRCGARFTKRPAPLTAALADVTCQSCIARADDARRAAQSPGRAPRQLRPCGTRGAYERHLRRGEYCPVCRPEPGPPPPCGTYAAYQRHYRAGEHCDICRAARNARARESRRSSPELRERDRQRWRSSPGLRERTRRAKARARHRDRRRAVRRYLATNTRARAAALTVCDQAGNAADAREVLEMLGLVELPLDYSRPRPHGPLLFSTIHRDLGPPLPALMEAAA